ncbi:nitrate reductase [Vreelandella utahensis]|uniref:nitrate reductase n=1 Tax=Vreelandella halophila TaxID=86177 RepID=UPI000985277E|nr:nitrate reductase [Halomonas utahensis]
MGCKTTCPYCGVGCGVEATTNSNGLDPVQGDPDHPANSGRLCVKGSALHETLGSHGRLTRPRIQERDTDWDEAIRYLGAELSHLIDERGGDSIAFYLSGQLLTEDYYVANKFAKGFIGTPHVDTNSRLCMSSAVAAHKRAFGEDVVPGCYEDLELADLVVLAGANPAWNHPILYQRMQAAGAERPGRRMVVIDPRRTASCDQADLHLALKPGTDAILWNGLLVWLADSGTLDHAWVDAHCNDTEAALQAARDSAPDPETVAEQCDLAVNDVRTFYEWFAVTQRTTSFWSQGLNQSRSGTDKANAIINCHLATGRIGRPGGTPFSVTGQPNAMGGREVGGLANQLAAHMDYDTPGAREALAHFWQAPALPEEPGHKAIALFEAIERGEIQCVWIMATNPLVSLPDPERARYALAQCPLVIVSDCVADTDTLALADVVLPAMGWAEKDGTVTNSERCISRQRGLIPAVGEARPDWWIVSAVARAMGFGAAFDYESPASIFREHARASTLSGRPEQQFNLGSLADLSDRDYDAMTPVRWPVTPAHPHGRERLFGDGAFATPDRRACFVPIQPTEPARGPTVTTPLRVTSGRIRDQWHTMTRTGRAARLLQHLCEPFIEAHPSDLAAHNLADGDLAWLSNGQGRYLGRVRASDGMRPGEVFVPIHWNHQFTPQGLASALFSRVTDPVSGQPETKHATAALVPFNARWHARLLGGQAAHWPDGLYWARVPMAQTDCWYLAGNGTVHDWPGTARQWLGRAPDSEMRDPAAGRYRAAWYKGEQLQAVLLVEPDNDFPGLDWLDSLFQAPQLDDGTRRRVLAGRDSDQPDPGPIICSCYQVGERRIEQALAEGCDSVSALGRALGCGTNCGSCVPELRQLVEQSLPEPSGDG